MSTLQLQDEITTAKRALQALSHPTVKRLAKLHPDAEWSYSAWQDQVCGQIHLTVRRDDPEDISSLPGVGADQYGYELRTEVLRRPIKIRGASAPLTVAVTLSVSQMFSDEEKDLLRAVGKLVRVTEPARVSYETLVCN